MSDEEFGPRERPVGAELQQLRKQNNPNMEPVGHFTGRCGYCGSKDLWDDATAYGCRSCGSIFMTGHMLPKVIDNATGQVYEFEDIYGD